mgnify:CR=1 FL=1
MRKFFFFIHKCLVVFYSAFLAKQTCLVCKKQLFSFLPICRDCINELFYKTLEDRKLHKDSYCLHCGIPLISEKEFCTKCRAIFNDGIKLEKQFLLFPYINKYTDIVLHWKNENTRSLSLLFASIIKQFIKNNPELEGLPIVPVPSRPKKIKTKGWDQIEDICFYLEDSIPIKRILTRNDGHSQKGLSKAERNVNMQDKIHIKPKVSIPKKVIILDDVITTGATIEACKQCLKEAGCQEVLTLVLFFN